MPYIFIIGKRHGNKLCHFILFSTNGGSALLLRRHLVGYINDLGWIATHKKIDQQNNDADYTASNSYSSTGNTSSVFNISAFPASGPFHYFNDYMSVVKRL